MCSRYGESNIMGDGDPLKEIDSEAADADPGFSDPVRFIAIPESTRGICSGETLPELLLLEFKLPSDLGDPYYV